MAPHKARAAALAGTAVLVGALVALPQDARWLYSDGGLTLLAALVCLLVLALPDDDWPLGRLASSRIARWVGDRSYATYLWHVPVIDLLLFQTSVGLAGRIVVVPVISLALADLSKRCIERPVSAYSRRRFGPSIANSPAHHDPAPVASELG